MATPEVTLMPQGEREFAEGETQLRIEHERYKNSISFIYVYAFEQLARKTVHNVWQDFHRFGTNKIHDLQHFLLNLLQSLRTQKIPQDKTDSKKG
jgi:uncharacterized UBP type Zn finger protein